MANADTSPKQSSGSFLESVIQPPIPEMWP